MFDKPNHEIYFNHQNQVAAVLTVSQPSESIRGTVPSPEKRNAMISKVRKGEGKKNEQLGMSEKIK